MTIPDDELTECMNRRLREQDEPKTERPTMSFQEAVAYLSAPMNIKFDVEPPKETPFSDLSFADGVTVCLSCSRNAEDLDVLDKARNIVDGDRDTDYGGTPERNLQRIADILNVTLDSKLKSNLTDADVALIFISLKLARESQKHKEDNLVDMAGYIYMLDMCY